jgi:hypothetical protein
MGKYEDDAKMAFMAMVGLIVTIVVMIIIEKC